MSLRRSQQSSEKKQTKENAATAASIDLQIKQDLFAKDIAYEGMSNSNLTKLSERENAKTIMLPDHDRAFRKTLEQFKLVKPCEEGLAVEERPRVSTTAHLNKRSQKKENPS